MHCNVNLKLRSPNTSYCLIEVVTKAGLTVVIRYMYMYIYTYIHFNTEYSSFIPNTCDINVTQECLCVISTLPSWYVGL